MAVTQSEVLRLMGKQQTQLLIHGHTHQVAKHIFQLSGKPATRFDVGDWSANFSFVEAQEESIKIIIRPIDYYQQ